MLGLGYPGGPLIEKVSSKGDPFSVSFKVAELRESLDFSFSGIKTAVLYHIRKITNHGKRRLTKTEIQNIASSFQESVNGIIIKKSLNAARLKKLKALVVGGGVSANKNLRSRLLAQANLEGVKVYFPEFKFCLDNGSMVALLGEELYKKGVRSDYKLTAVPNLVI